MCIFSKGLVVGHNFNQSSSVNLSQNKMHRIRNREKKKLLNALGVEPTPFDIGRTIGRSVAIGSAGAAVPVAGTAAGFTTTGIAAGSIAATVQSGIGSVAAGGTFATLQSLGATGALAFLGPISLALGGIAITAAAGTFVGIGIHKRVQEMKSFEKTYLIVLHV